MTLLVSGASTAVYQLRVDHQGKPLRKILDGALAGFGGSIAATYAALQNIPAGATEMEQLGIVLGLVAGIGVASHGAQRLVARARRPPARAPLTIHAGSAEVRTTVGTRSGQPAVLAHQAPKWTTVDRWINTNLVDHTDPEKGVMAPPGQNYLWAQIQDVRSYTTAVLRNEAGAPIQIAQSHERDEDRDIETVRLALFGRDGQRLPAGKYELTVQGDRGTGDAQRITIDFWIT